MKQPNKFKTPIIRYHAWLCLHGTNNTVFYNATTSPLEDQKFQFPQKVKEALNLPPEMTSFYEMKKDAGVYDRLYDLTIISLCSDIEYFFKDLFPNIKPKIKIDRGFYQRFNDVIKELEKHGYSFQEMSEDLKVLIEAFQVRHIAVHNMGYVDEAFVSQASTEKKVGEKYIVTQDFYKKAISSYYNLLDCIDNKLNC